MSDTFFCRACLKHRPVAERIEREGFKPTCSCCVEKIERRMTRTDITRRAAVARHTAKRYREGRFYGSLAKAMSC